MLSHSRSMLISSYYLISRIEMSIALSVCRNVSQSDHRYGPTWMLEDYDPALPVCQHELVTNKKGYHVDMYIRSVDPIQAYS